MRQRVVRGMLRALPDANCIGIYIARKNNKLNLKNASRAELSSHVFERCDLSRKCVRATETDALRQRVSTSSYAGPFGRAATVPHACEKAHRALRASRAQMIHIVAT
jgi:hypothetical protein